MDELELPEQLKGPWEHALILTYGLDVPFFENALWGQFAARCRNKIILADGRCYLEACQSYAEGGQVRHLNHRYVAEGVFAPRAAHAKAILLANPEQGRLLIGSGNLKMQGYASGGELFTRYEYSAKDPRALRAFLALKELVDGLLMRQYIGAPATRRIHYLWEQTPWLFQAPVDDWQPVRHNLRHSFLDQLQQAVGSEPVEELWVISPFYDREAVALQRLLTAFEPRRATLLMQPGYTSVDPAALQSVLHQFRKRCRVRSFHKGIDSPYIHAKMILIKTPQRAVCLQGSPNLSQVAMLLTVPHANIELANLLTGPRSAFDGVLNALAIETSAASLDSLDLRYQPLHPVVEGASEGWYLTGGEWHHDRLYLTFQGAAPDLSGALLVVGNHSFPLNALRRESQGIELALVAEAAGHLDRPVSVAISWSNGQDVLTTNPVFVCNRAALDAALEVTPEGETLDRIGDLDLDDEEFESLLAELDAALVIDRRSIWELAGRTPPATAEDDDEALRIDYIDVDYEMLRQHPRLQQYVTGRAGDSGYARTRLQIILNSITDHFRGLLDVAGIDKAVEGALAGPDGSQAETEDEREQEEEEKQRRRQSQAQRLTRVLKGFIRRYLRGIQSADFRELAGFEVMAQNYVIFSYVLWRMFAKQWVEPEFVLDSLLQTWSFFWGHGRKKGYFETLNKEELAQVLELVRGDQRADAVLLASLYHCARMARLEHWEDRRFASRDFWRRLIRHAPFPVTALTLENTWHVVAEPIPVQPPRPRAIIDELLLLANFETPDSFLRALESRHGFRHLGCRFENVKVRRAQFDAPVWAACLVVSPESAVTSQRGAVDLIREWMRFETLDYYRIASPDNQGTQWMAFYEVSESVGVYWARYDGSEPIDLGPLKPKPADWDTGLSHLRALAVQVEKGLTLSVREPGVAENPGDPRRVRQLR